LCTHATTEHGGSSISQLYLVDSRPNCSAHLSQLEVRARLYAPSSSSMTEFHAPNNTDTGVHAVK
jgi:hypothetical protein